MLETKPSIRIGLASSACAKLLGLPALALLLGLGCMSGSASPADRFAPNVAPSVLGTAAVISMDGEVKPLPDLGLVPDAATDAVGLGPQCLAVGDLNGDHKLDLVIGYQITKNISVMLGDGAGGFAPPIYYDFFFHGFPYHVTVLALLDLDKDTIPDLFVGSMDTAQSWVLKGDGRGGFVSSELLPIGTGAKDAIPADYDSDGNADLVVAGAIDDSVTVLLGNGTGGFGSVKRFPIGSAPNRITTVDLNGDGKLDVVTANYTDAAIHVLFGDGLGNFSAATRYPVPAGGLNSVAAGDFNKDGIMDVIAGNSYQMNLPLLLGDAPGHLGPAVLLPSSTLPGLPHVADFNLDGNPDVALLTDGTVTPQYGHARIQYGDGKGNFGAPIDRPVGIWPSGLEVADFNGDHKPDLAVINYGTNDVNILLGPF